ncbi:MAG TPA: hypothetical protein PKU91_01175, partial [Phycisphaerales bacterium]|nr:hypothetical protein [Phycisphaerales bacterium]
MRSSASETDARQAGRPIHRGGRPSRSTRDDERSVIQRPAHETKSPHHAHLGQATAASGEAK